MDLKTKLEAVKTSLRKMYEDGYISICVIDKCIRLMQIVPPKDDYDLLSTLHCVHLNQMSTSMRMQAMQSIMNIFSEENILVEVEFLEYLGQVQEVNLISSVLGDFDKPEKKKRFRLLGKL